MEQIIALLEPYMGWILLVSLGFNILLLILFFINLSMITGLKDKYRRLIKGTSGKNLEGLLLDHMERVEEVQAELQSMDKKLGIMENRMSFCIQKVGIIRYNAFPDVGSDLSYSIALLNEGNDGVIITGIHGRSETVTYAKPIKAGKSIYSLSVEELQALDRAKENALDFRDLQGTRSSREVG